MSPQRTVYHPLARLLHWTIAILILVGLPMGAIMVRRDFDPVNNVLYTLHWSIGLTILALMLVRLAVRLTISPPRSAAVLTPVQKYLSHAVHIGLYGLLFIIPVLGWLGKSAYGAEANGIPVFYLFYVPTLVERNEAMAEIYFWWHEMAVRAFLALLILHLAGAFYHAMIARDGVVGRMGIGRRVAEPEA
jgi:cytochrome b561